MATISRAFATEATIINAASVTNTETYSSDVDLETNGYEGAHVTIEADFPATPTDDLDWFVYGSLDGTNYDDVAMFSGRISNATDPSQISVIVKDVAHFRVGVKASGSTDTITVTVKYQAWRWQSV